MFETYDDILTIEDLADALKIGNCKAYQIVRSGKINAYKEGKDWKIPKQALVEYVLRRSRLNEIS